MIDPYRYNITVRKVHIDGNDYFRASVLELPDLAEYGDTYEEAYELAIDAIEIAAEMYADSGRAFPAPQAAIEDFSGRITLRMPKWLHRNLALQANADDISLNQYILSLLAFNAGFGGNQADAAVALEPIIKASSDLPGNVINFNQQCRFRAQKKSEKKLASIRGGNSWSEEV